MAKTLEAPRHLTWGRVALASLFVLVAGLEYYQVAEAFRGQHPDPRGLVVIHALSGALAVLAVVGLVLERRWAGLAMACWGAGMAAMLWELGPITGESREAWMAMRVTGACIMGGTLVAAWAVRARRGQ